MSIEYATCRTEYCGNGGIEIPILRTSVTVRVVCGVCGVEIIEVSPEASETPPADETELERQTHE